MKVVMFESPKFLKGILRLIFKIKKHKSADSKNNANKHRKENEAVRTEVPLVEFFISVLFLLFYRI